MSNLQYERPEVVASKESWQTIDDLTEGYLGIVKNNSKKYLPQTPSESEKAYAVRLSKAMFTNSFNDTIEGLTGLIFKEKIVYEDVPSEIQSIIENANAIGDHMDVLIQDFFKMALEKGIAYALVDMPKGNPTNQAEEIEQGIKPYVCILDPKNVTSWKTEIRNGQQVLTQVKIREWVEEDDPDNPYETEMVEQYRILEIGSFRVVQETDDDEKLIDEGLTGWDFIPLVGLNLNKKGFFHATPPFLDVAMLNIGHYQLFTDARYAAHKAAVPFYTASGATKDEMSGIAISPNTWVVLENPEGKVNIVDYDGKGAEVSLGLMNKTEMSIAQMGMNLMSADREVTATEAEIDNTKSQSKLNTYAIHLTDAMENVFKYAFKMMRAGANADSGGTIVINADILKKPLTAEEIVKLNAVVAGGNMSIQTMYSMIKNRSIELPDDFDIDVEVDRVAESGLLSNPTQGANDE